MSIHDPFGIDSLSQAQNITPTDIAEKKRKLGQEIHDIIEAAQDITLTPAGATAPLAFLASLPEAETDMTASKSSLPLSTEPLPPESVEGLSAFLGQNSATIHDLAGSASDKVKEAASSLGSFPSLPSTLRGGGAALATAILVDSINAEQAATGAKLGIVSASTATNVQAQQVAAADASYQSGIAQATATQNQATGEMKSGAISLAMGAFSAVTSAASMFCMSKAGAATSAESKTVTGVDTEVTAGATQAIKRPGDLDGGIEMTPVRPVGGPGGAAAAPEPAGAPPAVAGGGPVAAPGAAAARPPVGDAEAEAEAEAAAAAGGAPVAAPGAAAARPPVGDAEAEAQAQAAAAAQPPAPPGAKAPTAESLKATQEAWKGWGERWNTLGNTISGIGGGAASLVKGTYDSAAAADTSTSAIEKQKADVVQALASYLNQFMEASSTAAKTSMDNASATAQASQSIKQAASQSASSVYRG